MGYKVLVREKRGDYGHTIDKAGTIGEARDIVSAVAPTLSEGNIIYIRYSQVGERGDTFGYHEPNIEAYKIKNGEAVLVWKNKKHKGMWQALYGEEEESLKPNVWG